MPPKKKKSGKKKKAKGDGELTADDKYKRTLDEMEALKDQLAIRKEFARRGHTNSEEWKLRMRKAEEDLETQAADYKDVNADMTRQYKTMQSEMDLHIQQLRTELTTTKSRLEEKEHLLKKTLEEKERLCRDKDQEIAELKLAIDVMGTDYENVLKDSMSRLMGSLTQLKDEWSEEATHIQDNNKRALLEFGLKPLHL